MLAASEIKRQLLELVEGLDQQVENAPDLNAEQLEGWIYKFDNMPAEEKEDEVPELLFALAKALKYGGADIVMVM